MIPPEIDLAMKMAVWNPEISEDVIGKPKILKPAVTKWDPRLVVARLQHRAIIQGDSPVEFEFGKIQSMEKYVVELDSFVNYNSAGI